MMYKIIFYRNHNDGKSVTILSYLNVTREVNTTKNNMYFFNGDICIYQLRNRVPADKYVCFVCLFCNRSASVTD